MSDSTVTICPQCRRHGDWSKSKWRPFCSERCRLIDLGAWFSGAYAISEPLRPDHFAEYDEETDGPAPTSGQDQK